MTAPAVYALRDHGQDLAVEVWVDGDRNRARLLVDGEERAAGDADLVGSLVLEDAPRTVRVAWWWRGRVGACDLLEPAEGLGGAVTRRRLRTPFAPPAGTRAARLHAFAEEHPRLHAARHVVVAGGGVLVAVLGIGALVSALVNRLVPRIDWSWLPDWRPPAWVRYLSPGYWLRRLLPDWGLPDWDLLGWLPDAPWLRLVVPVLVAVAVARSEVARRRARREREERPSSPQPGDRSGDRPGEPPDGTAPPA